MRQVVLKRIQSFPTLNIVTFVTIMLVIYSFGAAPYQITHGPVPVHDPSVGDRCPKRLTLLFRNVCDHRRQRDGTTQRNAGHVWEQFRFITER